MQQFTKELQEHFNKMAESGKLFRLNAKGDHIYNRYIDSFSPSSNPVFRDPESSYMNCNLCKNFIRRYGNIVSINENFEIVTLFDFETSVDKFKNVLKELSKYLSKFKIENVFFETFNELNSLNYEKCSKTNSTFRLGIDKNAKTYTEEEAELYGVVKAGEAYVFHHLHLDIPTRYVDMSGSSVETIMSKHKDNNNVFHRLMKEVSLETLQLVRDLIIQGSLLNGDTHINKLNNIIPLKREYDALSKSQKVNWCWVTSRDYTYAKLRNELIGQLCVELSQGEDLNKACKNWNYRADPVNYMKAVAPFTEKQKKEAEKFVNDNGYTASFNRKLPILSDIKAYAFKYVDNGDGEIKEVSMFDKLKPTKKHQHKRNQFDNIEEVGVEKFINDILPSCDSVEVYLENRHENNMVTMTSSVEEDSKCLFKHTNNFLWDYNGNLSGKSEIKNAVKSKGGKVDGVLRFSMMWAEGNGDNSDLDLHCIEPNGFEIHYSSMSSYNTGGTLDVDITDPKMQMPKGAVENIIYTDLNEMDDGKYELFIHQYSERNSKGFKAEIEINGEIYSYEYTKPIRNKNNVKVAVVTKKNNELTIKHLLPESNQSKEIYNLETKNFHKVNLLCLSPNHWGDNNVGDKHYFFMLENCRTDNPVRSYHIDKLNSELAKHRKVLEPLASTIMIEPTEEQLSGLGFNSTVRDEVVVKLTGNFKRTLKIKF